MALKGFDQTVASASAPAGSTLNFGGTSTVTTASATLGGAMQMAVKRGATPNCSRLVVTANPLAFSGTLTVADVGASSPAPGDTFQLFSASSYSGAFSSITLPALAAGWVWKTDKLATNGSISVADVYILWTSSLTAGVNDGKSQDPDGDGMINFGEFAFDSNPLSAAPSGKITGKQAAISGSNCLVITLPVRTGAVFSGSTSLSSAPIDGVIYSIEGSFDLASWNLIVTEVTGATAASIQSGLPALDAGWSYRSFQSTSGLTKCFLRARATEVIP